MIVTRPISNDGPTQRRERDVIRFDEARRGDPAMTGPPFQNKQAMSLEPQESVIMKEPIRFSTAFCMWLLIGGPLL